MAEIKKKLIHIKGVDSGPYSIKSKFINYALVSSPKMEDDRFTSYLVVEIIYMMLSGPIFIKVFKALGSVILMKIPLQ